MTRTKKILLLLLLVISGYYVYTTFYSSKLNLSNETGIELNLINELENSTGKKAQHLTTYFSPIIHASDFGSHQRYPSSKCVKVPGVYVTLESKQEAKDIIEQLRAK